MQVTNQTIVLAAGDSLDIKMPNGTSVTVGFAGTGQVPADKGWVISVGADNFGGGERGHELELTGELKPYQLM